MLQVKSDIQKIREKAIYYKRFQVLISYLLIQSNKRGLSESSFIFQTNKSCCNCETTVAINQRALTNSLEN